MNAGELIADRYKLESLLGGGGFKVVWRASDTLLNRRVALAVFRLHDTHHDARNALLREARSLSALDQSPRIVSVYDVGIHKGETFMVLQLMQGGDLRLRLNAAPQHQLAAATVISIARDILEALQVIHNAGIVHRDLKPQNIWFDTNGNAVVGDFGISAGGAAGHSTSLNAVAGTIPYMAPEQLGGGRASYRSDLYALGALLYECLTGRLPYTGDPAAVVAQKLMFNPPPPSQLVSGVPSELDTLVMELLSRMPEQRPPSAEAALSRLLRIRPPVQSAPPRSNQALAGDTGRTRTARGFSELPTSVHAPAQTQNVLAPTRARRNLLPWALVTIVLLGGFAGGAVWFGLRNRHYQIEGLRVYNNVFEKREDSFEIDRSVAACFAVREAVDQPLEVVVTRRGRSGSYPPDQLATSGKFMPSPGSTCIPITFANPPSGTNDYTAHVLNGPQRLAGTDFRAVAADTSPAAAQPNAGSAPPPPPVMSTPESTTSTPLPVIAARPATTPAPVSTAAPATAKPEPPPPAATIPPPSRPVQPEPTTIPYIPLTPVPAARTTPAAAVPMVAGEWLFTDTVLAGTGVGRQHTFRILLQQQGRRVTGTGVFEIDGELSGSLLIASYRNETESGSFAWAFGPDGKSFDGAFQSSYNNTGRVIGVRAPGTPAQAVGLFYTLLSLRRYTDAYALYSQANQARAPFNQWLDGYRTTVDVYIERISQDLSNSVSVTVVGIDLVNGQRVTRRFAGTWDIVFEGGSWRLDRGRITVVP